MGLIRQKIRQLIRWASRDEDDYPVEVSTYSNSTKRKSSLVSNGKHSPNDIGEDNHGMHFTVFGATGGKIIQIKTFDSRTDSYRSNLHVITDGENLGEELAMIITREQLTR